MSAGTGAWGAAKGQQDGMVEEARVLSPGVTRLADAARTSGAGRAGGEAARGGAGAQPGAEYQPMCDFIDIYDDFMI